MSVIKEKIIRLSPKSLLDVYSYFKWIYRANSHESVYFYTFHKCASSLFSTYVLRNIVGLRHIDFANAIYRGRKIGQIEFKDKGYIYGPIRLSSDTKIYNMLVKPTSDINFIKDKVAIFLLRDPRDILVSSYYSFGFSHGISEVEEIKNEQNEQRTKIQRRTLDEFALQRSHEILRNFEKIDRLIQAYDRSTVLKYEDMIENWDSFARDLTKYIEIKPAVLKQVYSKSRPREQEDKTAQKRSGKAGGFKDKLSRETIANLNVTFKPILERFNYDT